MIFLGPYLAACALLVLAGVAKVARPADTATAFAPRLRLPVRTLRVVVRGVATAEAGLGVLAMTFVDQRLAALVAISYSCFAVVVLRVRSTNGAIASCGCFGTPDTPATRVHMVINAALALAAFAVAR